jgi:hypothetical protein
MLGFGYDACGVDAEDMTERELKLGIIAMAMKGNASKTDSMNKTELVASFRQLQAATMDPGDGRALNLIWAFAAPPPPDASAQEKHEEHSQAASPRRGNKIVWDGRWRSHAQGGGQGRRRCKQSNRKTRGRNSK